MHAYTFLLDKKLTEAIELKQKRRREAEFLEQKKRKSQLSIDGSNSSSTNTILDDCEPSSLGAGAGVEEPKVVIRSVDGESISDVIGVLISGVRILLMIVEGEEDLVK